MGADGSYVGFFAVLMVVMCLFWGTGMVAYLIFRSHSAAARAADAAADRERIRRRLLTAAGRAEEVSAADDSSAAPGERLSPGQRAANSTGAGPGQPAGDARRSDR